MRYLMIFLLLPFALAADLSGTVYDYDLQPLSDVVITVNTEPRQQEISKDGKYHFSLPIGEYQLRAEYEQDGLVLSAEEQIMVKTDGDFTYDLILLQSLDDDLLSDVNLDVRDVSEPNHFRLSIIISVAILGFIIALYLIFQRRPRLKDDDVKQFIKQIIIKHKRITQKEIRKLVPYSEAKISLVISELAAEGMVRKIKKGRGNIIILTKSL